MKLVVRGISAFLVLVLLIAAAPVVFAGMPVVVLDPGHSSFNYVEGPAERLVPCADVGEPAPEGGEFPYEGHYTWDIALRAKKVLEDKGYRVVLTKEDLAEGPDCGERAEAANNAKAEVLVSIQTGPCETGLISRTHNGASAVVCGGVDCDGGYYWAGESELLAAEVLSRLNSTGLDYKGVEYRNNLEVLKDVRLPAAVINAGYICNEEDLKILNTAEGRESVAGAIAEGVDVYLHKGIEEGEIGKGEDVSSAIAQRVKEAKNRISNSVETGSRLYKFITAPLLSIAKNKASRLSTEAAEYAISLPSTVGNKLSAVFSSVANAAELPDTDPEGVFEVFEPPSRALLVEKYGAGFPGVNAPIEATASENTGFASYREYLVLPEKIRIIGTNEFEENLGKPYKYNLDWIVFDEDDEELVYFLQSCKTEKQFGGCGYYLSLKGHYYDCYAENESERKVCEQLQRIKYSDRREGVFEKSLSPSQKEAFIEIKRKNNVKTREPYVLEIDFRLSQYIKLHLKKKGRVPSKITGELAVDYGFSSGAKKPIRKIPVIINIKESWEEAVEEKIIQEQGEDTEPETTIPSVCTNASQVEAGEDKVVDELVIFKGPPGCGSHEFGNKDAEKVKNKDPFCQKMYYCADGVVQDMDFYKSGAELWGLVSTGLRAGDKRIEGDKKTPEGTFIFTNKDKSHSYAPEGFVYFDTYNKLGYDAALGVHDIVRDAYIGGRRSDGCVRTYSKDMRKLFPLLNKGDPVTIKTVPEGYYGRLSSYSQIPTVVLDPGHGNNNAARGERCSTPRTYAVGVKINGEDKEWTESEFALDFAIRVRERLMDEGYRVLLTRGSEENPDCTERAGVANRADADAIVSLHLNAFSDPEVNGTETFVCRESSCGLSRVKESNALADSIHQKLTWYFRDRGVKKDTRYAGKQLGILREAKMPAVLVEIGFLTGEKDKELFAESELRDKVASEIAGGIVEYIGPVFGAEEVLG